MNVAGLPQLPPAGIYDFLDKTYKPLEGQIFSATYWGQFQMPQTNNPRDILVVGVQNAFAATLKAIMSSVVAQCGETVWKGITSTSQGDVWLWVEPTLGGINVNSIHEFKIEETTVFPCYPGTGFPHGGVSIKASLLTPPISSTAIQVTPVGTQLAFTFPFGMWLNRTEHDAESEKALERKPKETRKERYHVFVEKECQRTGQFIFGDSRYNVHLIITVFFCWVWGDFWRLRENHGYNLYSPTLFQSRTTLLANLRL